MQLRKDEPTNYKAMFESFHKLSLHWKGALSSLERVEFHMKAIENLSIDDSRKFLSYMGNRNWL
jgi:hypothetical protein